MRNRLDEAKTELLERAAAIAERGHAGPSAGDVKFLHRYYRHVPSEDLVGQDPVDVYGAIASQLQLARERPQGTAKVRVYTPTVEEHGWQSGHTVVEVVTDDMPFLVDSITMAINRRDRAIHGLIHPQLIVRRNVTGSLLEVVDASSVEEVSDRDGVVAESWTHVDIDRETDPAECAELERDLLSALRDVREAVEDWPRMRHRALEIADELAAGKLPLPEDELLEAEELLNWLADQHFTFLGYREYVLETDEAGDDLLRAVTGTGLGILRNDQNVSASFAKLPPSVRAKAREKKLLVLTKANSRATVHRPAYLDYVGVKTFDDDGEVTGERRFLGLFTSTAYNESVLRIPVLRRKVQQIVEHSGFTPTSHNGKDLLQILETYPRDELFQTAADDLLPTAVAVLHLQERRQLRLFVRADEYARFLSCLVYLPRDRYNTDVRLRMQRILLDASNGSSIDYTARVGESVLARLHFVIRLEPGQPPPELDTADLERSLVVATRSWRDDFSDTLVEQVGEEQAARLLRRYGEAFPEAYKEDFSPRTCVSDLRRLEQLPTDGSLELNLYSPVGGAPGERRFKIYRTGDPLSLTQVLPVLTRMGVEVTDERPYELLRGDRVRQWIYDFGLRVRAVSAVPEHTTKALFQDAFAAVWSGAAESDGFNALVVDGGLSWRQAMVLRAYAKYLRQSGSAFSQDYIEEVMVHHTHVARMLLELFEARFDPDRFDADADARDAVAEEITQRIEAALDEVSSLDQDRILRSFLALVSATLRTNFFQTDTDGGHKSYVSFKLDPRKVLDLPAPRPVFEVWVYSPRVEGVHLRFGRVARGGLRWSDRREDFRTEVLGLAKAQAVKNAVIVPVGAKGGFVGKRLPDPAADREAWLAEGIASYKTFIAGMLDITDNRDPDGAITPPPHVVRHDNDDPYLVVAADKGTATFSDIANGLSKDYGFWLGDAFASGGSAGYDHKAMGITARGAWESVERHFREMGRDCQTEDFTCVGIGDMSGDVFGNGVLLSKHLRLAAAFDHRHVFLDPDPDAAASWVERKRLFDLPRSSWADYDTALISEGGGVHPRTLKSIPVSPQVREVLGLDGEVDSLPPNDLMRAILRAPVDLLWNGGIGTYVKSSGESQADVGDKANDGLRVDGCDLRCRAVGEGGNLGFTQLGRVEYARGGGRINTDAIDNSAGVDTSDHEVNIKILLDQVVQRGDLTDKQRNELLVAMTDEVSSLVLAHNYAQNTALANAAAQAPSLLHVHGAYMRSLEAAGRLDRALEFLPADRQIEERRQHNGGLTSPELSVLLAYTKNIVYSELLETTFPDDPYLVGSLLSYFPTAIQERFSDRVDGHPLRREIITTAVVNALVNDAGITFVHRLGMETGAAVEELARGHTVARVVFDMDELWQQVSALDHRIDAAVQTAVRLEGRTLVERATRWLVLNRRSPLDIARQIEYFDGPLSRLLEALPQLLTGREARLAERRRERLVKDGVPEALAQRVAVLPQAYGGLGIVETSVSSGTELLEVAHVHHELGEQLMLGRLLERIVTLPRTDRWQTMARAALRDELHGVHAQLTAQVLAATDEGGDAGTRIKGWVQQDLAVVRRTVKTLREVVDTESADLARLSVGLRTVRTLLRAGQ